MTIQLPHADLGRFSAVPPETLVIAKLAIEATPPSPSQLAARLKALLAEDGVKHAVRALANKGLLNADVKIVLTSEGKAEAATVLGRDAGKSWDQISSRRFPLLALGVDPDVASWADRLAKPDAFKAAVITVSFGLPLEGVSSPIATANELIWRVVRARMSDLVGNGPFPAITTLTAVERAILAGLSGEAPGASIATWQQSLNRLAAIGSGLGAPCDIAILRRRVILLGLGVATREAQSTAKRGDTQPRGESADVGFATRVARITTTLSTPPFSDRVAIAQIYDAFGRLESDAGTLAHFKSRLLAAAAARDLSLARLDLPEALDKALRDRSETSIGTDTVHFVLRPRERP